MKGYVNADLFPAPGIDEIFSLDDIPYPADSVDEIASEHALEHLPRLKAEEAIKEWARVLKPGGKLWLKIPDVELCCEAFLKAEEKIKQQWYIHTLYGIQDNRNSGNLYDRHLVNQGQIHQTGFTKSRLVQLLQQSGLVVDLVSNYDGWGTPSIECIAHKEIKTGRISVGFFTPFHFEKTDGPTRIRRINVSREMERQGLHVESFVHHNKVVDYDVIILSSFGPEALAVAEKAKAADKLVVLDFCEDLDTFINQEEIFNTVDFVACCSETLADKMSNRFNGCKTKVIPDAYEVGSIHTLNEIDKLRVVYCGMGGNAYHAQKLQPLIESLGMSLTIISEWEEHDVKWTNDTWLQELIKYDIVITPQDVALQPAKSNNKVTQAMALGLPVLCSPLPAYKEVITNGVDGFICETEEEWKQALEELRSVKRRAEVGTAARLAIDNYSVQSIVKKWIDAIAEFKQIEKVETGKKRVAIINSSLPVKYESYGDHWIDGFRDAGCSVDVYGYNQINELPAGYDFYFFVELRYDPTTIPDHVHPRGMYCWDSHVTGIAQYEPCAANFDVAFFASKIDTIALQEKGYTNVHWVPEACNSHVHRNLEIERPYDTAFIGQQDVTNKKRKGQTRLQFLKHLEGNFNSFIGMRFYGEAYAEWLNKAKLGFDRPITYDIGTRLFEIAACGAVPLYPRLDMPSGIEELMEEGVHYVAYDDTIEDLNEKIKYYLEHDEERKQIALRAQTHVLASHTYKNRAEQILQIAQTLEAQKELTIVVPVYNNRRYLEMFLESVEVCTDQPVNIIVSDAGSTKPEVVEYLDNLKGDNLIVLRPVKRQCFSETINAGLARVKTPYVCLMNDDVIVSRNWLTPLMEQVKQPGVGAVGAFSNCALGWLHNTVVNCGGVDLVPAMNIEQIEPVREKLYDCSAPHDDIGAVHEREWIAFWNVVIPMKVVREVGILDTNFKNGGEDKDYCLRMRQLGYKIYQRFDSFLFHYGGKTRKINEEEDYEKHHEEDRHNNSHLVEKYASKTIVIYTGPAYEKWSPRSIVEGGIGGSETCCIKIAEEFIKKGYRVFVFNDCGEQAGIYNKVVYRHYTEFVEFSAMNHIDIFISSRRPEVFNLKIRASQKHVWVHDIWLSQDPQVNIHADQVDSFMVLSPWHKKFFGQHHNVPAEKMWVTKNGLDLERFSGPIEKDPHRLIYSSSPDRGLDVLLDVFPKIRERVPEANLQIFYGFDNWSKAIEDRGSKEQRASRDKIMAALEQPGIHYHGRIDQTQLAQEFMKAKVWAYPTHFWETFCITALEAMVSHCVPITTDLAALNATVGDYGILLPESSYSEEYKSNFVDKVVKVLHDDLTDLKHTLSEAEQRVRDQFNWAQVAEEWEEHFAKFKAAG